jgi:hypothetical protein
MSAWLTGGMFFLAIANNLILQASRVERYGMFLLSLSGAIIGIAYLIGSRGKVLRERGVRIFIGFFILIELIATIGNLYGRYNFSKSFLTSGFFGLVNAILLFWVIRLINEILAASTDVYKTPDNNALFANFEKAGKKVPPAFYFLFVIGWAILFGRSFYFFRKLAGEFRLPGK